VDTPPNQATYRKYRPRTWDEVTGQDHVVRTLKSAVALDRASHAYLFAGPRGTGKTTMARILAKAVNCLAEDPGLRPCNECQHCVAVNENRFLDLVEMDAASNRGIDDVRELRDRIGFSPSQGRYRVYIIDEAHMLTGDAFNALLKTLEEPPPHAILVLATTEIHKVPATVLSRCQRHEFRRVPVTDIVENLRRIVQQEGWQADEDALLLIARQATGSVRDAQSLLDQLASGGSVITLDLAQPVLGTATNQSVIDIVEAIQNRDSGAGLQALRAALDSGVDPRTLARQTVEYLRGIMLIQAGNSGQVEVAKELRERMQGHASGLTLPHVTRLIRAFNAAATDTRGGWQPSLALELALAEAMESSRESPPIDAPPPAGRTSQRPATAMSATKGRAAPPPEIAKATKAETQHASTDLAAGQVAPDDRVEKPNHPHQASEVQLAGVLAVWRQIRGALKHGHPAVDGLLNSCKPVEIRDDELILGFQSETVRAIMDRPENMQAAQQAIEAVLGRPLRLRCTVINSAGNAPPNLPQDGMVAAALHQGGEIVDIQE